MKNMGEIGDDAGLGAVGKASLIEVKRSAYDRLVIEDDEGVMWLVGAGADLTLRGEAAWEIMRLDFRLFCSLVNLVTEPPGWSPVDGGSLFADASADTHRFDAWVSPERALAWCDEYGLPIVEGYGESPEGWVTDRLRVRRFQEETIRLYLLHQLWKPLPIWTRTGLIAIFPDSSPHSCPERLRPFEASGAPLRLRHETQE